MGSSRHLQTAYRVQQIKRPHPCVTLARSNRQEGWGSGIHYSLKIKPIIHLIKILGYSLIVRKLAKKSDYSLFINFVFNSLKLGLFIIFRPSLFTIHYFLAHYSLFIIKMAIIH